MSRIEKDRYIVTFDKLMNKNGVLLQYVTHIDQLGPYPPKVMVNLEKGDAVDTRYNDGLWLGRLVEKRGNVFVVHYGVTNHCCVLMKKTFECIKSE